jgi:hypothetical protein
MSTAPAPAPHVSWIKKLGQDIVKGFEALASPKGQAVIAAGEAIAETVFPASAPVVALVNIWMQRAAVVEGKAQAAIDLGVTATGPQKAAAAIAAVTPDVEAILQQCKLLPMTPAQMSAINDAVLVIANALTPTPAAPPAA